MKIAVAFGPFGEFHAFNRFDCTYLYKLKKEYDKVVAVVPYVAASLITYADEMLCVSTEFLARAKANYPYILEQNERDVPGYVTSGFMKMAIEYINKHYLECDFHYFHDGPYPCQEILDALPPDCKIFSQNTESEYNKDMWGQFYIEFGNIGRCIKEGNFIYPFQEDKEKIDSQYKHLFTDKTFLAITRNFSFKAPMHNTRMEIKSHFEEMLNNGYGVVNIGFPCFPTGIEHGNYHEINSEDMTYSELLCLLYLSKGLIADGMGGAISSHTRSNFPVILTDKMHPVYQGTWNDRVERGIFSKKACMWEEEPITKEEFMNIINECASIETEKKYVSNNKCIMLDRL